METETIGGIAGSMTSELNTKRSRVRSVVFVAVAVWFRVAFLLGVQGAFVNSPGSPPLPIFFGVAIPPMMTNQLNLVEVIAHA